MAHARGHRRKPAGLGGGLWLGLVATAVILGGLLPAALLLLAAGMIPSATAFITDRDPRRMLFWTVLPLNFAGTMLYVMTLWAGDRSIATAAHMLTNPTTWLVMYACAAAGSLLHYTLPGLVTAVLRNRLERRQAAQTRVIADLRTEWGPEVSPDSGGSAPEEDRSS